MELGQWVEVPGCRNLARDRGDDGEERTVAESSVSPDMARMGQNLAPRLAPLTSPVHNGPDDLPHSRLCTTLLRPSLQRFLRLPLSLGSFDFLEL